MDDIVRLGKIQISGRKTLFTLLLKDLRVILFEQSAGIVDHGTNTIYATAGQTAPVNEKKSKSFVYNDESSL